MSVETFLSTWGAYCGAPKAVFEGQFRVTLEEVEASNLQSIAELQQRLIDRTKAYEEMDVKRVRRIRQLEDTVRRARTAFAAGGSYAAVAFEMSKILDEEGQP